MRSFLSYSLVFLGAALSAANAAVLDERSQCLAEICGDPNYSQLSERHAEIEVDVKLPSSSPTATVASAAKELTNGERLARGLPLKPPTRRKKSAHAARAQASPVPTFAYTGYIQVRSGDQSLGYITSAPGDTSGMLKYTPSQSQAISFSISLPLGATSGSQVDISMPSLGGALLGLVQGRDDPSTDLGTGSFNYLYITGVTPPGTAPNTPAADMPSMYTNAHPGSIRAAETSVWTVDILSGALDFQWTNSDGSSPSTTAFVQSTYLYAGGDTLAFFSRYPSPITTVYFKFIPTNVIF